MLNKKFQQAQDQSQKDIETRIQVIMFMMVSTVKALLSLRLILSRAVISLNYKFFFSLARAFKNSLLLSVHLAARVQFNFHAQGFW